MIPGRRRPPMPQYRGPGKSIGAGIATMCGEARRTFPVFTSMIRVWWTGWYRHGPSLIGGLDIFREREWEEVRTWGRFRALVRT